MHNPQPTTCSTDLSALPYLADPEHNIGRAVFTETNAGNGGYLAVKAGRWKYVEYNNGDRELYDLVADPYELQSLHGDPTKSDVIARLAELIAGFRECAGAECVTTGFSDSWPGDQMSRATASPRRRRVAHFRPGRDRWRSRSRRWRCLTGVMGASVTGKRLQGGPMGKADRVLTLMAAAALAAALGSTTPLLVGAWLVLVGALITATVRLVSLYRKADDVRR